MSTATKHNLVPVEEYLAGELLSPVKHEYLGGVLYAMAGARIAHVIIATNTTGILHAGLTGSRCRAYNSDLKIRVRMQTHVCFYYPDASVSCGQSPQSDSFLDDPVVLVEVLSAKTRRVDEGEKKVAYLTIPSLRAYLLIEQETAAVVVLRRTANGFVPEAYHGLEAVIPLPEIGVELPLARVYDGVGFTPEIGEDASR